MEVGRQKSEVGLSLFFLLIPTAAVLKRRPLSLLAQKGMVCSGGKGFPHFVGTAGDSITQYQSEPGVPVIKWGFSLADLASLEGLGIL